MGCDHVESQISGAAEQRRGEERADFCEMATLLCSVLSRVARATLATGPHGVCQKNQGIIVSPANNGENRIVIPCLVTIDAIFILQQCLRVHVSE